MLTKKFRLKKEKEIEKVLKEKGWREKFLVLKRIKNDLRVSRFCFIVPEKVSKKATLRNKIKRRLREIVRGFLPQIKEGFDFVFISLPGIEKESFWELKRNVFNLLKKSKNLK